MTFILTFTHAGFTTAKYADAIKQLKSAGAGALKAENTSQLLVILKTSR
ncbi:MAG TPA: hypothetical protein VKR53_06170 [Puia sp.]|nr:hypothetical protein [Puia sp.]